MNDDSALKQKKSFGKRFLEYQKERFPLVGHGPLIVIFTFSAAAYSRVCRGAGGFIPLADFLIGALTSLSLFLLLRLADEFKDAEEDARYRPYRPVPRGLVSLAELRNLGIGIVLGAALLNAVVMPSMLPAYGAVLLYMALMGKEFFVAAWLKRHPVLYMLSHMVVMPLIDFYTTGLDWLNQGVDPPRGLEFFLLVTFLNGVVIEIGRKIRAPEAEEVGVETYSALYGPRRAAIIWLMTVTLTYGSALAAGFYAGFGIAGFIALTAFLLFCSWPAVRFLRSRSAQHAALIEKAAGIWTVGMYLTLGAVPMILRAFSG